MVSARLAFRSRTFKVFTGHRCSVPIPGSYSIAARWLRCRRARGFINTFSVVFFKFRNDTVQGNNVRRRVYLNMSCEVSRRNFGLRIGI